MRLLLLTARPELAVNRRFAEAAAEIGVELVTADGTAVTAVAGPGDWSLEGLAVSPRDTRAVIARIGNWRPESLLAVLEVLVESGVETPNPTPAIRLGRDHWATVRVLAAAGLPVPASVAGADPERLADAAVVRLGLPVVVKQRRSRMGVGVIRCTTRDHLEAVLDSLWRVGDEVMVQRWVDGGGHSLRLLVVDNEVVAAARFTAAAHDWRSNAARGGAAAAHRPSALESQLALRAAAALGLGHCGVDLVPCADGPMLIEVNPSPGFLRLEAATGVDVAAALVRSALRLPRPRSGSAPDAPPARDRS